MQKNNDTVLIIEDEASDALIVSALFKNLGYNILSASDGIQAIEIIERRPKIDLLFIDVMLSAGVNGIILARALRNIAPHLKIILNSGYPIEELERDNGNCDEFTFLKKPYRLSDLARVIREVHSAQIN